MNIVNQVIHDEANSSVSSEGVLVDRQLEIDPKEFNAKRKTLEMIIERGRLGSKFVAAARNSSDKALTKIELVLFTADGAGLTVSLTSYGGNSKCYFGTRGSPTKLFSGQNLLEIKDAEEIDKMSRGLGCSRFEALSLYGFYVFAKAVAEEFAGTEHREFFNEGEKKRIRDREVGVFSVGFATYEDFGEDRTLIFGWLVGLYNSRFPTLGGVTMGLAEFYGVEVDTFPKGRGGLVRKTSLLLNKYDNGRRSCSACLYLKDQEVEDKKDFPAGKANHREMGRMSRENRERLKTCIRVDNVFYAPYLRRWLKATNLLPAGEDQTVLLRDVAPLFSSASNLKIMVSMLRQELGLRTLLKASTVERILALSKSDASPLSTEEKELLVKWTNEKCSVKEDVNGNPHLSWSSTWSSNSARDRAFAQKMFETEFIDMSLPMFFYTKLDTLRTQQLCSLSQQETLDNYMLGNDTAGEGAPLEMQNELKRNLRGSLKHLRAHVPTLNVHSVRGAAALIKLDREGEK